LIKIDDQHIKKLLSNYQSTAKGIRQIIELVSEYIYNYPRLAHRETEDSCSEFFIYFIERLPKLLNRYEIRDALFTTWLLPVIRRHYINWIKKRNHEEIKSTLYEDDFIFNTGLDSGDDLCLLANKEINKDKILDIINSLPKKLKVVIKLHYFDFFDSEDILETSKVFQRDINILIDKYSKIVESLANQYDAEKKILDQINTNFIKLSSYGSGSEYNEYSQLKNKSEKLKLKNTKLIEQYRRSYLSVKTEDISDFLGITSNAVYSQIFRGKLLIKKRLLGVKP
jgi:RNA polymerase sigma factor (sigma-70 family)